MTQKFKINRSFRSFLTYYQPNSDFQYYLSLTCGAASVSLQDVKQYACHPEPPQNQAAHMGKLKISSQVVISNIWYLKEYFHAFRMKRKHLICLTNKNFLISCIHCDSSTSKNKFSSMSKSYKSIRSPRATTQRWRCTKTRQVRHN